MCYAFFWCQEFGTRLLEHKEQRGTKRESKRKGELLNNFSHMPTLQRTEGERIPFWAPRGAELRWMEETATGPGAKGTLRQSSRFPFYYLVVSRDANTRGTRRKNVLLGGCFLGSSMKFHLNFNFSGLISRAGMAFTGPETKLKRMTQFFNMPLWRSQEQLSRLPNFKIVIKIFFYRNSSPKMKIVSSFTYPQVVQNLYQFHYSV